MSVKIDLTKDHVIERLRGIEGLPPELHLVGMLPHDSLPTVAIVGARMCSEYGRYMARQYGQMMALNGVQVITQMSLGISGIAAKAALDADGMAFAVLGTGVDVVYPPEHLDLYSRIIDKCGAISQFSDGTVASPRQFYDRNRLLVALSDAVVVIEARKKSGVLSVVDYAHELGKPVFAVPGRVTDRLSDGVNDLLKRGVADIALDPNSVAEQIVDMKEVAA